MAHKVKLTLEITQDDAEFHVTTKEWSNMDRAGVLLLEEMLHGAEGQLIAFSKAQIGGKRK